MMGLKSHARRLRTRRWYDRDFISTPASMIAASAERRDRRRNACAANASARSAAGRTTRSGSVAERRARDGESVGSRPSLQAETHARPDQDAARIVEGRPDAGPREGGATAPARKAGGARPDSA